MKEYGGVLLLCLCWSGLSFDRVYCQKEKYAPQNVTTAANTDSIQVTWSAPAVVSNQSSSSLPTLKAYRVQVVPNAGPKLSKDHWVPKSTQGHLHRYEHKVTCLDPRTRFNVSVLAVYGAGSNISEENAVSESVGVSTTENNWLQDLLKHPIQIAVGAGVTLLVMILVIPLVCYCMYRRHGRRRMMRLNNGLEDTQQQTFRKSSSNTALPSADSLRKLEARRPRPNHSDPDIPAITVTPTPASLPRAIQQTSSASHLSPLMHYSPPSSYQAATPSSVPSQAAPSRPPSNVPEGDVYELEEDVYENVLHVPPARIPPVKSTSFSGVVRPGVGKKLSPLSVNAEGDGDGSDDDENYENSDFGRNRCVTMPSSSKSSKVLQSGGPQTESIYGNCQF